MAKLGNGAVAVVGHRLDQDSDAVRTVALIGDLVVMHAVQIAAAALDGAVDGIVRHIGGLGVADALAQAGVGIGIAPAGTGRDGYFLDELGEDLAALGVGCALLMLDCVPL